MIIRSWWFKLSLVGIGLFPTVAPSQGGGAKLIVAGFETTGSVGFSAEEYDALGLALTAILSGELSQRTGAATVAFGPSLPARGGRIDLVAARARATSLGATSIVIGSLLDEYGDIHLEATIHPVVPGPPSGVIKSNSTFSKREQLTESLADLAAKITAASGLTSSTSPAKRTALPVDAMLQFGRGLIWEVSGDRPKATEAYRAALKLAPGFTEASAALQRSGGI